MEDKQSYLADGLPVQEGAPVEVFLGSDHRGFEAKNHLVAALNLQEGLQVADLGPFQLDLGDDYNDIAVRVAQAVLETPGALGVLVCGSAHGVAMQANRFRGVRAIEAANADLARLGRSHNDANILCLSADFIDQQQMLAITQTFIATEFSGEERHARRIAKLDQDWGVEGRYPAELSDEHYPDTAFLEARPGRLSSQGPGALPPRESGSSRKAYQDNVEHDDSQQDNAQHSTTTEANPWR